MRTYTSVHLDTTEEFATHVADTANHVSLTIGNAVANLSLILPHSNGHQDNAHFLHDLADACVTLANQCNLLAAAERDGGAA